MGVGARRVLLVTSGLALIALAAVALATGAGTPRPSLVLVTVAGLRADDVTQDAMPHLAALASGGQAFELQTNVPLAAPALAALFAADEPDRTGVRFDDLGRLAPGRPTLAARLAEHGYHAWGFVGDGRLSPMSGLFRGFERVRAPSTPFDQAILPDERERLRPPRGGAYRAAELTAAVADTLKGLQRVSRVFAWIHLAEPSLALSEAAGEARDEARRRALREVDDALGTLRGLIDSARMGRRVALVVVSVHGEALGEQGETRHGLTLGAGVVRVPVVARLPAGARLAPEAPVLSRLGPALLAALGIDGRPDEEAAPAPLQATWLPSRRFGWPDRARTWSADGWTELAPDDARARGAGLALDRPAPAHRDEVLAALAEADTAARAGDAEAALAAFDRAARLAPEASAPRIGALQLVSLLSRAVRARLAPRVSAWLADLERIAADGGPELRIDLARALLAAGRRDEAARLALEIAGEAADVPAIVLAAADVLSGAEQFEQAASLALDLAQAEGAQAAPELFEWAGDRLLRGGNAYRARQAYERALSAERGRSANLLAKLGDAYAQLGDPEAALRRWAEAVRLDPSYRYPHLRAGEVLLELGRTGAATHAMILSAPRTGRPIPDALARARILENHGLPLEAAAELWDLAREHPRAVRLQATLVHALGSAGHLDRAREVADRALALVPDSPLLLAERARIEALAEDDAAAARWLARAQAAGISAGLARRLAAEPAFRALGEDSATMRLVQSLAPTD